RRHTRFSRDWSSDVCSSDLDRGDGGALLATAGDLVIWNEALTNGRLGDFVTGKLHEPTRLNNGRELTHTRGLFLGEDPLGPVVRSEERRVGKGWRSRRTAGH